ncbi:pyridoxal phosphate-dependent transferase [Aspergillus avenaceus]|uniref:Pyridoxal phosphate-dependent transferase n=1 Tax=Aspergillus avenaceus TaxID=36643 RepID=A0A5N6TKH5_ASPAV|nr:pyridoxal phosphate-dependent transferase [Aspergillus avenaceus]
MTLDIPQVRSRFPALNQEQVFLDNAGGSQVLDTVIESITSYLSNSNVQLGATYKTSKVSTAAYGTGYEAAAKFINAKPEEICLGVSTTQLFHNLSTALKFQPGDEVILAKLNHEVNSGAWNPACDPNDLAKLMSEKTRLVACPHASNIVGTIVDVKEIAKVVPQYPRALLCVDGVALAPYRQVDVKDLDVDFYAFSWYKVYGPHISQLYASSRVHDQLYSLGHFFKGNETLDLMLNLASANYELVQSIPHVVEYFGPDISATWEQIADHEEKLQKILLDFLNSTGRATVYGQRSADKDIRVPVISFTVQGAKSQALVDEVEKRSSYGFRSGHMYSHRLIKDIMGLDDVEDGVVRISMLHYNTEEEMTGLVKVLSEVLTII